MDIILKGIALLLCFAGGFVFRENKIIGGAFILIGAVIWAVII